MWLGGDKSETDILVDHAFLAVKSAHLSVTYDVKLLSACDAKARVKKMEALMRVLTI